MEEHMQNIIIASTIRPQHSFLHSYRHHMRPTEIKALEAALCDVALATPGIIST